MTAIELAWWTAVGLFIVAFLIMAVAFIRLGRAYNDLEQSVRSLGLRQWCFEQDVVEVNRQLVQIHSKLGDSR